MMENFWRCLGLIPCVLWLGCGADSSGTGASAGHSGAHGTAGHSGAAADAGEAADGGSPVGNRLSGTLGALGAVKPVMAGWATTNGNETLIYLSSASLSCAMMMTKGTKWLATLPAGSQVIEIVVRGTPNIGTTPIGSLQGEVNYAEGSKSSSTEVNATGGSIMFTKAEPRKVFEGKVTATYPKGSLMGTFHADWCEGGSEF
jgi:hypothetical protein